MHAGDAIGTEQNVTLWANWRNVRSRYKRIQLYRTDFQEFSGPIRIKRKQLVSGQIVIFRVNFFRLPVKCFPVRLYFRTIVKFLSDNSGVLEILYSLPLSVASAVTLKFKA